MYSDTGFLNKRENSFSCYCRHGYSTQICNQNGVSSFFRIQIEAKWCAELEMWAMGENLLISIAHKQDFNRLCQNANFFNNVYLGEWIKMMIWLNIQ